MKSPEPKLLVVTKTKMVHKFPFDNDGAAAAVELLDKEGGSVYKLTYHIHHPGTKDEEWLPRSFKIGEQDAKN